MLLLLRSYWILQGDGDKRVVWPVHATGFGRRMDVRSELWSGQWLLLNYESVAEACHT